MGYTQSKTTNLAYDHISNNNQHQMPWKHDKKNINYYPEFEKKGRGRNVLQLTTESRRAKFILQSNCNQTLTIFEKWNTIHKTLKIVLFQACPAKTKTKGERDFCWHRDKVSNRAALMWHGRATRHGYPVPHCCLVSFCSTVVHHASPWPCFLVSNSIDSHYSVFDFYSSLDSS